MKDKKEKWIRIRLRFVAGIFTLLFALAAAKAFDLQVLQHSSLKKEAERQHQRMVKLIPSRGTIYDRNMVQMAVSVEMDTCYAVPKLIENIDDATAKLAPLLNIDRAALTAKLKGNKNFVWLQRRMTPESSAKIKGLKLKGIEFVKETKRFYPNSEIASNVIGFTGLDPAGLEGVEKKYDATILGSSGYLLTERDALGRDIDFKGVVVKGSKSGNSLLLTIDRNIQYIAERELASSVMSSRAKAGVVLVMDPSSGRILAMANYPSFNPNSLKAASPAGLRNRSISDAYEPGSTFKTILLASAIEEKIIRPSDRFSCENGVYTIGGKTIHDTHRHGVLSAAEVLKYSSNIGAAKIGSKLGSARYYNYIKNFGFGEKTEIDLPGEASGTVRDRNQWYGVDLATISFGQGITITPIQLITAISSIANGGLLMKPYLVEKIIDENGGILKKVDPEIRRRVISKETSASVAKMMEGVTINGGTGMNAAVDGYRVAGKTGTSQKVDPYTHSYSPTKRIASFVGFVPLNDPKLAILVILDEPQTSPYGGVVSAPAFKNIAEQSLRYLHVPMEVKPKEAKESSVNAKKIESTEGSVAASDVSTVAEGGEIKGDSGAMPDFRNMSMRQVLKVMAKHGVNVRILGSGRVVQQSPLPGQKIGPDEQVWVKLSPSA